MKMSTARSDGRRDTPGTISQTTQPVSNTHRLLEELSTFSSPFWTPKTRKQHTMTVNITTPVKCEMQTKQCNASKIVRRSLTLHAPLTQCVKRVQEGLRGRVDTVADVVVEDLPALLQVKEKRTLSSLLHPISTRKHGKEIIGQHFSVTANRVRVR